MQIQNLRPMTGAGSALARFDIELSPQVKLLDWTLKRGGRVFPPSPRNGSPAAVLAPELIAEITRLALEGVGLHEKSR
ncbi:hypothetical protein [Pelagibacterium lentulum]|uniref:Uncharacterized protein n=1 Tax=Pelagibacterium lentulum TaxID=2029865 RepID=A0A916VWZ0_9HYPH|nr:hypothetical protein [Pelagibacterium lentulum]GGA47341.1 hypothetical protein GCM10011499_16420 [Pelagibacterium lentulum]